MKNNQERVSTHLTTCDKATPTQAHCTTVLPTTALVPHYTTALSYSVPPSCDLTSAGPLSIHFSSTLSAHLPFYLLPLDSLTPSFLVANIMAKVAKGKPTKADSKPRVTRKAAKASSSDSEVEMPKTSAKSKSTAKTRGDGKKKKGMHTSL